MKSIKQLFLFLSLIFFASCAEDIIDLTGDIKGTVKDADDGHLIENCLVTLTPGNKSVTTNQGGAFMFENLEAGRYTLSFKKSGYPDHSQIVAVVTGDVVDVDVLMKAKEPFVVSEDELDFGDFTTSKQFFVVNNSDARTSYVFSNLPKWLNLSRTSGTVDGGSQSVIVATIDRESVDYGEYRHNIIISYTGRTTGETFLPVKFEKVQLTVPNVTCHDQAKDVTETSFAIEGNLVATGGSPIIAHGHCWSLEENPTIDDDNVDLGKRTETGIFVSTITGLNVNTTYFVRAYAQNAQGITYSDQVAITTNDVYSDKWDGKIASRYAGGSGTKADPYIIKTGGQLLYALKQGKGNVKLANNIDLNNYNWKPYDFSGTLDGAGYMISNLYIERSDEEYHGLIGYLQGNVSNLTIRGVKIKGGDNVGAVAGRFWASSSSGNYSITNCHVILTQGSVIQGVKYVGGIVGHSGMQVTGCTVKSVDDGAYIGGEEYVGGVIGTSSTSSRYIFTEDCHVNCNVFADDYAVGGIVGSIQGTVGGNGAFGVKYSSYEGNIMGKSYVGGIAGTGSSYAQIYACKVIANIESEQNASGIYNNNHCTIVACYSCGTISSSRSNGISDYSAELCYTTMKCNDSNWRALPEDCKDSYSVYDTDNIARKLEEAYSDYAEYWDFKNTWTWTGTVNGKTKSVICPRLAWE